MSQVSGQRSADCDAPHGTPSAAPGPAPTPSLPPELEVVTEPACPVEVVLEEGSLEEAAPPMPQDKDSSGALQSPDSTDLNIPIEAVTPSPGVTPDQTREEPPSASGHVAPNKTAGGPAAGEPLVRHPTTGERLWPTLRAGGTRRAGNGALGGPKAHRKLQTHPSLASQGSRKSKSSAKSATSQIPLQAQEDCCVHCILSCLFCEFLTLCNIVLDCATCGSCSSEDSCLCCCCGQAECSDCELPCDLDCGILDACCESADCLEICMECCGLCFSS